MTVKDFLSQIEKDNMLRLRWVVLKKFGIFPMSTEGKNISDEDILLAAAQMVLDNREAMVSSNGEKFENENFDVDRFIKLAEANKK